MAEQKIIVGNCIDKLEELADNSVHCVVTSPPYWGLRDYGNESGIGLEQSFETYLSSLARVFGEVRRVLREDGTLWLNMGDSYTDKSLTGQPWQVAFMLRSRGWYLRSDIIWHKPNPMPESVQDRPTKGHEYIFLLTKSPRYFYDIHGTRQPCDCGPNTVEVPKGNYASKHANAQKAASAGDKMRTRPPSRAPGYIGHPLGKNLRTVWTMTAEPFPGLHFATFPEKLVARCLKAGTSDKGACSRCGTQWNRKVDRQRQSTRPGEKTKASNQSKLGAGNRDSGRHTTSTTHAGWAPLCGCGVETVAPIVLDPFSGAGTVGVVCKRMGLNYIGIELNPEYAEMSRRRIQNPGARPLDVDKNQELLFAIK